MTGNRLIPFLKAGEFLITLLHRFFLAPALSWCETAQRPANPRVKEQLDTGTQYI